MSKVRTCPVVLLYVRSPLYRLDGHGTSCHGMQLIPNVINCLGDAFLLAVRGIFSAAFSPLVKEQLPLIQNAPLPSYIKPLLLSLCSCVGCVLGCHDDRHPRCQPTWDWLCTYPDWCSAAPGPAPLLSNDTLMEFYCRFFRL